MTPIVLLVVVVLLCVSLMILGAAAGKPLGFVAIGFAVLALLIALFGGPYPFR